MAYLKIQVMVLRLLLVEWQYASPCKIYSIVTFPVATVIPIFLQLNINLVLFIYKNIFCFVLKALFQHLGIIFKYRL